MTGRREGVGRGERSEKRIRNEILSDFGVS